MVVFRNHQTADSVLLHGLGIGADNQRSVLVGDAGRTDCVHKCLIQGVDNVIGFLCAAGPFLCGTDHTRFVHALEDQAVVVVLECGTDLLPDVCQDGLIAFQFFTGGCQPCVVIVVYIHNDIQPVVIGVVYNFLDAVHPRRIDGAIGGHVLAPRYRHTNGIEAGSLYSVDHLLGGFRVAPAGFRIAGAGVVAVQ